MDEIFRRIETKYFLDNEQYLKILQCVKEKFLENKHSKSTICNIYFDTKNYDLARLSIDKPKYKEKVRARVYKNNNGKFDKVFLEIKKKCDGVVSKRRVCLDYEEYIKYINFNMMPKQCNLQIMKEIDYAFKFYRLLPVIYISYEREAYFLKDNEDFRLTIDTNLRYRENNIDFKSNEYGELLSDKHIMEVKSLNSYPIWFVKILSENKIYPSSFSKYGEAYKQKLTKKIV